MHVSMHACTHAQTPLSVYFPLSVKAVGEAIPRAPRLIVPVLMASWSWSGRVQLAHLLFLIFWGLMDTQTHTAGPDHAGLNQHLLVCWWYMLLWCQILLICDVSVPCFQGDQMVPCAGRDCSTCQCFPAKGAMVPFQATRAQLDHNIIYPETDIDSRVSPLMFTLI